MNAAGYIYVLAFDNGTVKVGRTQNTDQRLNSHKSDAGKFGVTLTDHWVSPPHTEWMRNEDELKKIAAGLGGTVRRKEYFSGVDYATLAAAAEQLTFTPPAPAAEADPASEAAELPVPQRVGTMRDYDNLAGYIYVTVRRDGILSADVTTDAAWCTAPPTGRRNDTLADSWVSPLHLEWQWNVDSLRAIIRRVGGVPASPSPKVPPGHPAVKSYFSGVNLEAIRPAAERLSFTPPPPGWAPRPTPQLSREECLAYVGRTLLDRGITDERMSELAASNPLYAEMAAATAQEMIRDARKLLGAVSAAAF